MLRAVLVGTLVRDLLPQTRSSVHLALGGAYDTVPEVAMLLSLFNFSDSFVPVLFDEAGASLFHCVPDDLAI